MHTNGVTSRDTDPGGSRGNASSYNGGQEQEQCSRDERTTHGNLLVRPLSNIDGEFLR